MIRFSHEANSWQVSYTGLLWIDIPVDLARGYFDDGMTLIIGSEYADKRITG